MAHKPCTNDATRIVALWLAHNARDFVAQTSRECFLEEEDLSHAATALATEIADGIDGEVYTASMEDCDSDLATVDLLEVDYLQIATSIIDNLYGRGGN